MKINLLEALRIFLRDMRRLGTTDLIKRIARKNDIYVIVIHIYLEDCLDKINCLEITHEDLKEMD